MRLNVGCGKNLIQGWINVDISPLPGVDILADLDKDALPLEDNSVDEIFCSHTLEHLKNPLFFMQEMWRVAKPDAKITIHVPYGSSDDADEDPTHVRRYFLGSFYYFTQLAYNRADYGYRADWNTERIKIRLNPGVPAADAESILRLVKTQRNVVLEMIATLRAVKPARAPSPERYEYVTEFEGYQ